MRVHKGMRRAHAQDNQANPSFLSQVKDGLVDGTQLSSKCPVVGPLSGQMPSQVHLKVALLLVGLRIFPAFHDVYDGQPGLVLSRQRRGVGCRVRGLTRQVHRAQHVPHFCVGRRVCRSTRPHRKHRTTGMPKNRLGNGPQRNLAQPGSTVRAYDDQVHILFLGDPLEFVPRLPLQDHGFVLNPRQCARLH